jgi:hypothetical protein
MPEMVEMPEMAEMGEAAWTPRLAEVEEEFRVVAQRLAP